MNLKAFALILLVVSLSVCQTCTVSNCNECKALNSNNCSKCESDYEKQSNGTCKKKGLGVIYILIIVYVCVVAAVVCLGICLPICIVMCVFGIIFCFVLKEDDKNKNKPTLDQINYQLQMKGPTNLNYGIGIVGQNSNYNVQQGIINPVPITPYRPGIII